MKAYAYRVRRKLGDDTGTFPSRAILRRLPTGDARPCARNAVVLEPVCRRRGDLVQSFEFDLALIRMNRTMCG